jgi:predicted membrane-bound spermidine synthase
VTFPAHLISFLVGFLSLGSETLWVRTYAFANQSTPHALAVVLGLYLLGIARGASIGGDQCKTARRLPDVAVLAILAASAVLVLTPLACSLLPRSNLVYMPLIFLPAMLYSICFPICHHLGTQAGNGRTGRSLSRVYAANIAGSVCGPLFVNFGVLEVATTQTAFVLLGLAGIALAAAMALATGTPTRIARATQAATAAGVAALSTSVLAGNTMAANMTVAEEPPRHIVETRQGILISHHDGKLGDTIYGGNVYDGRTNVDPRINSNGINRIVMLSALAPKPKRVLVIGLSIGSWQHLIGGFPGVETMDVIEINPGYLTLANHYDVQRRAIEDPRVTMIIGDGRKFLRQNPDRVYDLVVMNTTWHWRMYASLLLSREFLTMVKRHMTPEAVLTFNTTDSPDALKTATAVFPHAYLYDNFVVAGQWDWRPVLTSPAAVTALRAIKPAGKPLFGPGDSDVIADYLDPRRVRDLATVAAEHKRPLEVITDRNLVTEYKHHSR